MRSDLHDFHGNDMIDNSRDQHESNNIAYPKKIQIPLASIALCVHKRIYATGTINAFTGEKKLC